ncbi:MAG TPA: MlaD family protein [Vicinamibacterales bacterium]|jgi:phospholipid/cholesterol/gamma-HCH transport system substrate-binding protein|nr:MlaD family protein [Vicinamibacterales bacterium]
MRQIASREVLAGVGAIAVAAVLLIAFGWYYLATPGQRTIVLETSDAATMPTRTQVRIAGLPVGTVTEVRVGQAKATVTLRIDDSIDIGDTTSADVRMLTAVGGFYIALQPSGTVTQSHPIIPQSRVLLPYLIGDLVTEASAPISRVALTDVGKAIDASARGMQNDPNTITSFAAALNTLATTVNSQSSQLERALTVSNEYSAEVTKNREVFVRMTQKASIVLATMRQTRAGFESAYRGLAELFSHLLPVTEFYTAHREALYYAFLKVKGGLEALDGALDPAVQQLDAFTAALEAKMRTGGGPNALGLLASDVCIPAPGAPC